MFEKEVKLSKYSHYKIGGRASYFCEPKSVEEIIAALAEWRDLAKGAWRRRLFVLGGGTNVLFNDDGFDGLVLKPNIYKLEAEGEKIKVGAGVLMNELAIFAADHGLAGLEWAGGLPGTVGGAVRGNAGAFGDETKSAIFEVASLDISLKAPRLVRRMSNECAFGYRDSIFKQKDNKEIVIEATMVLKKGESAVIRRLTEEKIQYRQARHPMEYPSIGSIFKNVSLATVPHEKQKALVSVIKNDPFPVVPAAYLIAEAGLKGVSFGGAMVSPKHSNFIVNTLNASASDVRALIKLAKKQVKKKFGIKLEEEIIYA